MIAPVTKRFDWTESELMFDFLTSDMLAIPDDVFSSSLCIKQDS